jgi:hypothetical protein
MGKLPWDVHAEVPVGDPALRAGRQRSGGSHASSSAHSARARHGCKGTADDPAGALPTTQEGARRRGIDAVRETAGMLRGRLPLGSRRRDDTARLRSRWQRLRSGWQRRPAVQAMMLICLCLLWSSGGGDDSAELQAAKLRLADTFDLRKQLSGESTYPHRYRSTSANCCGGSSCVECQGEKVGNIDATRFYLESEIRLLRKIGCPCRIEKLSPPGGPAAGGTGIIFCCSDKNINNIF